MRTDTLDNATRFTYAHHEISDRPPWGSRRSGVYMASGLLPSFRMCEFPVNGFRYILPQGDTVRCVMVRAVFSLGS